MITRTERQLVEFLKRAKTVKIVAEGECGTILELKPSPFRIAGNSNTILPWHSRTISITLKEYDNT